MKRIEAKSADDFRVGDCSDYKLCQRLNAYGSIPSLPRETIFREKLWNILDTIGNELWRN